MPPPNEQHPYFPFNPFPYIQLSQERSNQPQAPPTRVRVAMGLLSEFTDKTKSRIAGICSDIGYEINEYKGQELCDEELILRLKACKLIGSYLDGNIQMDKWEQNQEDLRMHSLNTTAIFNGRPTIMNCPMCTGGDVRAREGCGLCKGTGSIFVYASSDIKSVEKENE